MVGASSATFGRFVESTRPSCHQRQPDPTRCPMGPKGRDDASGAAGYARSVLSIRSRCEGIAQQSRHYGVYSYVTIVQPSLATVKTTGDVAREGSGSLLPPSPPTEETTARDQTWQSCTGDWAGNTRRCCEALKTRVVAAVKAIGSCTRKSETATSALTIFAKSVGRGLG
jgi:hypothetical protein